MMHAARALAPALLAVLLASCSGDPGAPEESNRAQAPAAAPAVRSTPPTVAPYEPGADEEYPNGKRLAARIAQRALTYPRGMTARRMAAALPASGIGDTRLARILRPGIDPGAWSAAKVIYPQLSGVTASTLGAMVVVRQTTERADGSRRALTRVVDVRLANSGGKWALDAIESVGGSPAGRPARVSTAAKRVLDNPSIELAGSARWDIHRGAVDDELLRVLADAAENRRFSIAVFSAGHPRNVWGTARPSAHSDGLAADIYAVDSRPVIAQRSPGSPAYELAAELYAAGAYQLGSPWVFGTGGARSFTDAVHQDHIHVQQSPPQ